MPPPMPTRGRATSCTTIVLVVAFHAWLLIVFLLPAKDSSSSSSDQDLLRLRRAVAVRQANQRWTRRAKRTERKLEKLLAATPTAKNKALATPTADSSSCPPGRRPYHFLLTASNGAYQQWQTRILYYHYVRLRREQPCSDMGGFTRLLTTPGAKPDDLMNEIRTVVVEELNEQQTMGFVVLNRPNSVLKALESGKLQFEEEYVLVAETDHLLLKVLKNTATKDVALGYPFHYMNPTRDANTRNLVRRFAGSDDVAARVQQVGPSPILVHMEALRKLVKPWYDLSFALKRDAAADAEFGWMLEMWGYSIGAAVAGVKHELLNELQLEPSSQFGLQITSGGTGGWTNALGGGGKGEPTHHILHYTFSHEYSLEGIPMIDSRAGQWALDKREYQKGLPRHLIRPPYCAAESTWKWWSLLNQAMAAHDTPQLAPPSGSKRSDQLPQDSVLCDGCTGGGAVWPNGTSNLLSLVRHDRAIRNGVEGLLRGSRSAEAFALIASGPWALLEASPAADGKRVGPFYFLRGGQMHTPWGSAAWAAAPSTKDLFSPSTAYDEPPSNGDPIVIYLCGRKKWTHSLRLETAGAGIEWPLQRGVKVLMS